MAKPELGAKRQCQSCSTKFFDLNREPIACPKCGAVFQALPVARSVARAAPVVRDEVDTEAEVQGAELVSLEDAEASEKVEVAAEEDIEVEDTPADDTFLEEEEEEDDDVAALIDGDIENDEEG